MVQVLLDPFSVLPHRNALDVHAFFFVVFGDSHQVELLQSQRKALQHEQLDVIEGEAKRGPVLQRGHTRLGGQEDGVRTQRHVVHGEAKSRAGRTAMHQLPFSVADVFNLDESHANECESGVGHFRAHCLSMLLPRLALETGSLVLTL